MSEKRVISKTGAELQDVVQLLDKLTAEAFIPYNMFTAITGTPAVAAIGGTTAAGYAMDATSAEAVTGVFNGAAWLPGIDSTKPVKVSVYWSAAATSGDVVWELDCIHPELGVDIGGMLQCATTTDTTLGTADASQVTESMSMANVGEQLFFLAVRRAAADGGDTMAGDASFHGVKITYTTNPNIV